MYFYNFTFEDSNWGIQGDVQYRDWHGLGDRQQLLLRSGVTYSPEKSYALYTFGFANLTSGVPGPLDSPTTENRIYQEARFPVKIHERLHFAHRFRYEQRWVEGQDFRTKYRYALSLNMPLNNTSFEKGTVYLSMYDEVFFNGQQDIGIGQRVDWFDRNWMYFGLGYVTSPSSRVQFGWMEETTANDQRGQLQFSLHMNL